MPLLVIIILLILAWFLYKLIYYRSNSFIELKNKIEKYTKDCNDLNDHIYELKKGVRQMVLYTTNRKYEDFAVKRLTNQKINYIIQPVGNDKINLFFGRKECINAIRFLVNQPLNKLSPEQDFILGAMLGYDICAQCKRYCERKVQ